MAAVKRVLIYGGRGALGSTCVKTFKAKNMWVCSVDLHPNEDADVNVVVKELSDWVKQQDDVMTKVSEALVDEKLDAILCVAGGWAGGSASSKNMVKNADLMWKQSVWSSTICARLATMHLKTGGVLTLPGAQPALEGTSGMIGYGMAKAAVHQLTKSLGQPTSGLPEDTTAVCILPMTLDTPMNRKGMPNADFTSWTSLEYLANLFLNWTDGNDLPPTGSLLKITTKDSNTTFEVVP